MNWFKGLFGFPTKSEVIRDTILTLAKDRTLLESALSLSNEMNKHKAKTVKAEHTPATVPSCIDATEKIAELAANDMKHSAIVRTLNRNGFFYQSRYTNGLTPFRIRNVRDLLWGRTVYSYKKGYYVSSDRELQKSAIRGLKRKSKGLNK